MPNQGFNLEYRLYLEGVNTPFKSAKIASTPNGTNASFNIYTNKLAHDILPKTSVQMFFKEWLPNTNGEWRLMFDGFTSAVIENESAVQGRIMSVQARDFMMDMDKLPAALVWDPMEDLNTTTEYAMAGLHKEYVIPGGEYDYGEGKSKKFKVKMYNKGEQGLVSLSSAIGWIAGGSVGGVKTSSEKGTSWSRYRSFKSSVKSKGGKSDGAMFLDSFVRGIWSESVGGSNVAAFLNKRMRVDKKIIIPKNKAGYNLWTANKAASKIGSYLMGNAKFSSVAAAIMRIAGIFNVRVQNCSTPTAIYIGDNNNDYVIHEKVKSFMVDNNKEFGGKYILNEMTLLPPVELSAPPICNVIMPSMYDNIYWTHDYDSDATRGQYKESEMFSNGRVGASLGKTVVTVPNYLFSNKGQLDKYGREKLPITIEERYKGIGMQYSEIDFKFAAKDASDAYKGGENGMLNKEASAALEKEIKDLEDEISETKSRLEEGVGDELMAVLQKSLENKKYSISHKGRGSRRKNSLRRHALLRFMNAKLGGRVLQVGMHFNPYILCGYPSVVIAGVESGDSIKMKDLVGQVTQVQHDIQISTGGASATTSIVLNGARFVDEPTDMDENGSPLYAEATVKEDSVINEDTYEYENKNYYVGNSHSRYTKTKAADSIAGNFNPYDYESTTTVELMDKFKFAKDYITITAEDYSDGEGNSTFLDKDYTPNQISKFYRDVFGMDKSIMIGTYNDPVTQKERKYYFDTVHEAVEYFKSKNNYIYENYEKSMETGWRRICSIDEFYGGILGCSVKTKNNKFKSEYKTRYPGKKAPEYIYTVHDTPEKMRHNVAEDMYYGISSEKFDSGDIDYLIKDKGEYGRMNKDGEFSSILENIPVTALIKERRDAVEKYINNVTSARNYKDGNK